MTDPRYEQFLRSEAVEWHYEAALPLAAIDVDATAIDNIRLSGGLDDETVLRYMLALDQGDQFPAILVYPTPKGHYGIVNGIHRRAAFAENKLQTIDAYVVHLDPTTDDGRDKIHLLRRIVNVRVEGKTMSPEEAMAQAVQLVNEGHTPADAAARLLIKPRKLSEYLRHDRALAELSALTARSYGDLSRDLGKHGAIEINRIPHDVYKKHAVDLICAARMNAMQTRQLAIELIASRSTDESDAILARWREEVAPQIQRTAGGRYPAPLSRIRDVQLRQHRFTAKVDELLADKVKPLTVDERRNLIRDLKIAVRHLQKLIAEHEGHLTDAPFPPPPKPKRRGATVARH